MDFSNHRVKIWIASMLDKESVYMRKLPFCLSFLPYYIAFGALAVPQSIRTDHCQWCVRNLVPRSRKTGRSYSFKKKKSKF